jgi:hypothetical protein
MTFQLQHFISLASVVVTSYSFEKLESDHTASREEHGKCGTQVADFGAVRNEDRAARKCVCVNRKIRHGATRSYGYKRANR